MAVGAVNELNADLAQFGGAGDTLNSLALTLSSSSSATDDFAAINLGQLKNLTQPFYDRLLALGYTQGPLSSGTYPWADPSLSPDDYATANIGQLKNLFSFDVTYSATGASIPDWWLAKYGITESGTYVQNTYVPWSGGQITYTQAYQNGLNPIDYYNGQPPLLAIVSGNNQTGSPATTATNGFVPAPLVISATDSSGDPIVGAPVVFAIGSGEGQFWTSDTTTPFTSITILTDANGLAQVFYQLGSTQNNSNQITATAGIGAEAPQLTFLENSDDGSGTYTSPFAPANVIGTINADGSEAISWQINDASGGPLYVYTNSSGSWIVTTLAANTTEYTAAASDVGNVQIGNAYTPGGSTGVSGTANPGVIPYVNLIGQDYGVIDITAIPPYLYPGNVLIDDSSNIAFPTAQNTGAWEYNGYQFSSSNATLSNVTSIQDVQDVPQGSGTLEKSYFLNGTEPNGTLLGTETDVNYDQYGNETGIAPTFLVSGSSGMITPVAPFPSISGTMFGTGFMGSSQHGVIYGNAGGSIIVSSTETDSHYFEFIWYNGAFTAFDPMPYNTSVPSNITVVPQHDFQIQGVNDSGWAIGYDGTTPDHVQYLWTGVGGQLEALAPMTRAYWINNTQQVLGSLNDGTACLWTDASSNFTCSLIRTGVAQPLSELIPKQYKNEIQDITPVALSGTNSEGSIQIIIEAEWKSSIGQIVGPACLVLTLQAGATPSVLRPMDPPAGYDVNLSTDPFIFGVSANGSIPSWGVPTGSSDDHHTLDLLPVELAVDGNRDGTIALSGSGGSDQTTEDKPYRFWVNDDQDSTVTHPYGSETEVVEGDVVPVSSADYNDTTIQCKRDLEDWTRLWISFKGDATLIKAMVQNGDSVGLQFEAIPGDTTDPLPQIKICEAAETSGSTGYLTDDGIAGQQITSPYNTPIQDTSGSGNTKIGSAPFMLPSSFWTDVDDNTPKHLIFEGVTEGKGKLTLVFYDSNNNKIGEGGAVYLDIKNIKKMYQRGTGDANERNRISLDIYKPGA